MQSNIIVVSGIYDPQKNGLNIDMWSNSKGEKIKTLFNKINLMNLSSDANEILEIALLTNSYFPKDNISIDEFSKFKSDYLIKTKNLDLIKKYPPNIALIYSKRSAESFDEIVRKYSLAELMTQCVVMCISKKIEDFLKSKGWKKTETFNPGEELIKIDSIKNG